MAYLLARSDRAASLVNTAPLSPLSIETSQKIAIMAKWKRPVYLI